MTDSKTRTITLTVGTAGHIDHGKTELVKFLTGCNTDRLPEEKERGMTIDLGFATCELPNHRRVGIVDVPGHERFIHNMVAGATGIDVAILVIAADDGVMPQTIEHFHILRMLGVKTGMIVINKMDLVSKERVDEVSGQAASLIAGSFLEGCPIVPFSARTGEGFNEFHSNFVATVDRTVERGSNGPFRLNVERAFILKGLGTIISGIPCSGRVKLGDEMELLPTGDRSKVRGIQVYGTDAEEALAGECTALKMSGASKIKVQRGMVLATPGFFTPASFINARFQFLPHISKPLKPRTSIRLHIGTTDVPGHMILPELTSLQPGSESYVQFQLRTPVIAAPGDFFVVRMLSPVTTIGGGYVVAPVSTKMRRTHGDWINDCINREKAFEKPETALAYILEHSAPEPMTIQQLAHLSFMNEDAARRYMPSLLENGHAVELPGGRYTHPHIIRAVSEEITAVLNRLHDAQPVSIGFPKRVLFRELHSDGILVDKALDDLIDNDIAGESDAGLHLKARLPQLSDKQARTARAIETVYKEKAFTSPSEDELPELLGMPAVLIKPVLDHLVQTGVMVKITDKIILHSSHVNDAREKIISLIELNGPVEPGHIKDLLGTSRKYSIPLMEYFDRIGLTVRKGNGRILRKRM